jgi:predicted enzyme related to lactoylglutathione lyase
MRFDVFMSVKSSSDAIKFYVQELGLFEETADYGMSAFLMTAVDNRSIGVHVREDEKGPAVFGLRVANCAQLVERLKSVVFASGGRVDPELLSMEGGQCCVLHDPSDNRIILFDTIQSGAVPRLDIFLRVKSASDAVKFYVDETAWFKTAVDFGMNDYLLLSARDESMALHISETKGDALETPSFGISASNCDREHARIAATGLQSGASFVRGFDGGYNVLDWPGGKNFVMQDPSSHRILVYQDYIAPAGD